VKTEFLEPTSLKRDQSLDMACKLTQHLIWQIL